MWRNREHIADFVLRHEDRIRAIARRKLPTEARSVFGTEDVFSTVARRVDALAAKGLLRAESEAQLWALVSRVVENVSLERGRLVESTASRTGDDAAFWADISRDLRRCRDDNEAFVLVFEMMSAMTDAADRQIFLLRLRGVSHRVIAQQLGATEDAVRQRWVVIRRTLRESFSPQGSH
jgi:DNA-directed RNA polymerase specialized sigma24 family protein